MEKFAGQPIDTLADSRRLVVSPIYDIIKWSYEKEMKSTFFTQPFLSFFTLFFAELFRTKIQTNNILYLLSHYFNTIIHVFETFKLFKLKTIPQYIWVWRIFFNKDFL